MPRKTKKEEPPMATQSPFGYDIIGDVHGCAAELHDLIVALGYVQHAGGCYAHPGGRKMIFVGDLVNRGPDSTGVLDTVAQQVNYGNAIWVLGNHDCWCRDQTRYHNALNYVVHHEAWEVLDTKAVPIFYSATQAPANRPDDPQDIIVVHAAYYSPRQSELVSVLGVVNTDVLDGFGYPVMEDWISAYTGPELVVYGHQPVLEPLLRGKTINIDTGCVFGGKLTAFRFPERESVSVDCHNTQTGHSAQVWDLSLATIT